MPALRSCYLSARRCSNQIRLNVQFTADSFRPDSRQLILALTVLLRGRLHLVCVSRGPACSSFVKMILRVGMGMHVAARVGGRLPGEPRPPGLEIPHCAKQPHVTSVKNVLCAAALRAPLRSSKLPTSDRHGPGMPVFAVRFSRKNDRVCKKCRSHSSKRFNGCSEGRAASDPESIAARAFAWVFLTCCVSNSYTSVAQGRKTSHGQPY